MTSAPADPPAPPHSQWAGPVLLLIVFLSLIGFGVVIPLLPFYVIVFDAPPWQVTLMFATFSLGQFLGELTWGPLSDRVGRRPVLLITIFVSALGYLGLAFAPNIWLAVLARAVAGFFSGNISVIQGYIVDVTPEERLAGRLGMIGAAFSVGFVVGPSLGGLLANPDLGAAGLRPPLLVAGVLCVLAGIFIMMFVPESLREGAHRQRSVGPASALKHALGDPVLRRLVMATFVLFAAFSAMWSTVGLWGRDRFDWEPRDIGVVMAMTGVGGALCQGFLSGYLVRRIGARVTVVLGLGACSVVMALQSVAGPVALAVACVVAAVMCHAVAMPALTSLVSHAAPQEGQGATLGAINAAGAFARVIGPVAAGVLFSTIGSHAPIMFASAGMLPALWLIWRAKTNSMPEPRL
ncbi:MFS transporter [Phenylobacterium sp.]|uniref:MFS transporter n=1 Tax=Phenylobacterium sp. TaxID=1871053 RepID=UPI0027323C28|nr:MFS transporter [Phenylobacterium sp.]MDP3658627.1 MFS transporter [Phenylobacterium sp.]